MTFTNLGDRKELDQSNFCADAQYLILSPGQYVCFFLPHLWRLGHLGTKKSLYIMIWRVLVLVLLLLCRLSLVHADDWPQWRGPERTGVSKEKDLLTSWPAGGPKLLWIFRDAGAGFSSMSIVGDRLYSMGGDGKKNYVFAIDLKTQEKLWSTEVGPCNPGSYSDGPYSTPTVDGIFLYAIGGQGDLVCVETATGKKVWSQDLKKSLEGSLPAYGYGESPLVDGDRVVVSTGGDEGAIAAFDKRTGTQKWRSTDFTYVNAVMLSSMIAIELGGVRQYLQITRGGGLAGVRASDGKLLWAFRRCNATNTPIYRNDCVYVSCEQGCWLFKLKAAKDEFKVEKIYFNRKMQNQFGGVILINDYLYGDSGMYHGAQGQGGWMCQNFQTGKVVWHKNNLNLGHGSAIYADGNLYCYHGYKGGGGDVLLIKATPDGYQEQGKFRIPEQNKRPDYAGYTFTHPVVANGKLYLRDQDLIFCYDVRKPR